MDVVECDVIVVCLRWSRWCDAILLIRTSGFASESASELDLLDSRIRIRALNGRFRSIQAEYRLRFGKSNTALTRRLYRHVLEPEVSA